MTSLPGNTSTLRHRLLGALTATGLGGTAAIVLLTSPPSAVGAADPCAASEVARTISNVARSAGDYLDGHPEMNQAMTAALQQSASSHSLDSLGIYLSANPKAANDLQTIALPLAGLSSRCQTPLVSLPQVLGFAQPAPVAPPAVAPGGMPSGVISGVQNSTTPGAAAAKPGAGASVPGVGAAR